MQAVITFKSFKGHKGRPGQHGGSAPRGAVATTADEPKPRAANVVVGAGSVRDNDPNKTPIYRIYDATNLTKDFFAVAVGVRGKYKGVIIACAAGIAHSYMLAQAGLVKEDAGYGNRLIDEFVRMQVNPDTNGLYADFAYAGVAWVDRESKVVAMDNIYKACDILIAAGLSQDTPLAVTSKFNKTGMLVTTVHKELIVTLKSFTGHKGGSLPRDASATAVEAPEDKFKVVIQGQGKVIDFSDANEVITIDNSQMPTLLLKNSMKRIERAHGLDLEVMKRTAWEEKDFYDNPNSTGEDTHYEVRLIQRPETHGSSWYDLHYWVFHMDDTGKVTDVNDWAEDFSRCPTCKYPTVTPDPEQAYHACTLCNREYTYGDE